MNTTEVLRKNIYLTTSLISTVTKTIIHEQTMQGNTKCKEKHAKLSTV